MTHPAAIQTGMGMGGPKVSAVFLICCNDKHGLSNLRSAVAHTPGDCDFTVVANGVNKGVRKGIWSIVRSIGRVTIVEISRNLGVVAKNLGYAAAQGKYILSVDSDVCIGNDVVAKYSAHLDAHPGVGLVGPCGCKIKHDGWTPTTWCGVDEPGFSFGYTPHEYLGHETVPPLTGTSVDSIPSLCWMFRRSLLREVGYLDWRFTPFVGSDSDFCFRIKEAGVKLHVVRAKMWHQHKGGQSHPGVPVDMGTLRHNHLKELYDRWYAKVNAIAG